MTKSSQGFDESIEHLAGSEEELVLAGLGVTPLHFYCHVGWGREWGWLNIAPV